VEVPVGTLAQSIKCAAAIMFVAASAQAAADEHALPGPPPNLDAGAFRQTVDTMWERSPKFRRQCARIALEPDLAVTIRFDFSLKGQPFRAHTTLPAARFGPRLAAVVLQTPDETIELVAHEIEHVVEYLDGVDRHSAESARAIEAGRQVAREVGTTYTEQHDPNSGPLDPASASISANGRTVVLTSYARLSPDDEDDESDLYTLDIQTGDVHLESQDPGWASGYRDILYPRISGDGDLIVFEAMPAAGDEICPQVVLLDRRSGTARVVSAVMHGKSGDGPSEAPAISADGTTVVFQSRATNLVAGATPVHHVAEIYRVRIDTGEIARVTSDVAGARPQSADSVTPVVSGDGRFVAFTSAARNHRTDIYVYDSVERVTSRVSRSRKGGDPDGRSSWPAISADGRFIAFTSDASNLVDGDRNHAADVFVVDRTTGLTEIASRTPAGLSADGPSRNPAISGDGSVVAFQSLASNLLCVKRCAEPQRDINLLWDVYVLDREHGGMLRASASGDESGEWMEPSWRPSMDEAGHIVTFSSRHPVNDDDVRNDEDLFIWRR